MDERKLRILAEMMEYLDGEEANELDGIGKDGQEDVTDGPPAMSEDGDELVADGPPITGEPCPECGKVHGSDEEHTFPEKG